MTAAADLRVPLEAAAAAFGVPAIVRRPDLDPIEAVVIWLPFAPQELPAGFDTRRREPLRLLAVASADVPTLPRTTVIEAAEILDGPMRRWQVDAVDRNQADEWRAMVVPLPDEGS